MALLSALPSLDLPQSTSTGGFSAVVDGLTNGRNYRFRVQAYNAKFLRGGEAQVGHGKVPHRQLEVTLGTSRVRLACPLLCLNCPHATQHPPFFRRNR